MRGASPREICLTSRSQASSSTRAGREQAPGERPGREGPACSKDDTATEARVRAAAERGGGVGGGGAGVGKPSWLPEKTLSFIEGLPVCPTISGKTYPFITLPHFLPRLPTVPSCQGLDFWGPSPSTVDLTSSSEQGTQRPLPKGFDVQEGFIPDAHGDHLLHSEL